MAKAGDGEYLRSVAESVLQIIMETDVDGLTAGGLNFNWNGSDEGDQIPGTGWQTFGMMAVWKARSPITTVTERPSSPSRALFQQPARPTT